MRVPLSRPLPYVGIALLRLLGAAALIAATVPSALADAYDTMRVNWFNNITGGTAYSATDADIASVTASLNSSASNDWTLLNNAKPFDTTRKVFSDLTYGSDPAKITATYSRLQEMSRAYWAKGGTLYQNASLKADIISALDWLDTNIYNSAITNQYGNWFEWQIGTPLNFNNVVVLLYDSLTPAQVTKYMAAIIHFRPNTTVGGGISGANSAWAALIVGLHGVIIKNDADLSLASSTFSTLTASVTAGDGFYNEGSNIGHGSYSYTGGYGLYMLGDLADGYYLFNPAALYPLPASKRTIAYNWALTAYQPLMFQGKIPYYTIGREISRGPSVGRGRDVANAISQFALGDTSAQAGLVRAFAKHLFAASGASYSGLSMGAVIRFKNLMTDSAVTEAADPVSTTFFPIMDKVTTMQGAWSASVSYYSQRTHNYESINGENLKGWHLSDGLLYLDNADWNQYNGNFWATVDSTRLSGTTVTVTTGLGENLANGNTFAGGADVGGQYGGLGFILQPGNGQTLVADKAYFFFDDEVVCLGNGITSTDGKKVETIVENRKLNSAGSNLLTINGIAQPTSKPWSATQSNVKWMHLAGSVTGSDIGYYFPTPASLDFIREARTSSWSTLDAGKSTASVTDSYLTVGNSHGTSPSGASYGYILLPNYSAAQVAAYAASPVCAILQNDKNVSAVYDGKLGVSGAVFWQDQVFQAAIDGQGSFVSSNKKAVVMTQAAAGQLTVTVTDPTETNTAGINLEVTAPVKGLVSADSGVSVTQLSPTLKFTVATSGAKGRTFHAVFATSAPPAGTAQVPIAGVSASTNDGNVPSNTIDNNFSTRWSANGNPQWIQYDFPGSYLVTSTAIAFYGGTSRTMPFDVQTSLDATWTTIYSGVSSGTSALMQSFPFGTAALARHVRIVGHGASDGSGWNSLTEVQFFGTPTMAVYADWAQANFTTAQLANPAVSGWTATPAGDGMSNLLKYSQGLAPSTNVLVSGGGPLTRMEAGYLTLTYVKLKNAADLVYTPQVSGDLANWFSGNGYTSTLSTVDLDADRQQIKVRSNATITGGAPCFLRLMVTDTMP